MKRRRDLAPGESFQEAVRSAARGVRNALAHSERVAVEIYADLCGLDAHETARIHRLGDHGWNAVIRAFERGYYVIVAWPPPAPMNAIAWGAKVSPAFRKKVVDISLRLETHPDFLMACMAFESSETFSSSVRNAAGSGAVGLIQFMPETAHRLNTNTRDLADMTPEDQLDYVERYFSRPGLRGRLGTIEDLYMAILWPAAVGKAPSFVLFEKPSVAYKQNAGLDADRDGKVTKFEAAAQVRAKLLKGGKFAA